MRAGAFGGNGFQTFAAGALLHASKRPCLSLSGTQGFLKVIGTTTDRWDRRAVAFGVETPDEGETYRTMLMFNPQSGRLTNYLEEFLLDDDPETRGTFDINVVNRYIAISE